MPTILDSLVVELGLDPKKFTQGQRDAVDAFKRSSEEARQQAKNMEEQGRRIGNAFGKIRNEAIAIFGAAAGAYGIKQFVGNLIAGDAAVGRFARTTGMAADDVSKWSKAIELAGGNIGSGVASLAGLNDQIQNFRAGLGGSILPIYNQMAAEGGTVIDINKSITEQLLAIAKNARAIEARTAGRGGFYLRQLGLDENAINVLIRGDQYTKGLLDQAERLGAAIKKDTEAAEKFLGTWRETGQLIEGIFRPLQDVGVKAIEGLNEGLREIKKNQEEQQSRGPGAGQAKFNSWANYIGRLLGIGELGPDGLVARGSGQDGSLPPTAGGGGGIFGGLGFQPMGWQDLGKPTPGGAGPQSSVEVNINGPITVTTNATDAEGVASGLSAALASVAQKRRLAALANTGQE